MSVSERAAFQKKHQSGFGLIEILIAVLLFGIGAVGLASMQVNAKRMTYEAVQRSIATSLARDIVERMRNNPNVLSNYVVTNYGDNLNRTQPTPNCSLANCTPIELAAYDIWEWERALIGTSETTTDGNTTAFVGGLSQPRACITHNNGDITVAIVWLGFAEHSNPNAGTTCGEGLGLYGTNEASRQVILINTFIDEV